MTDPPAKCMKPSPTPGRSGWCTNDADPDSPANHLRCRDHKDAGNAGAEQTEEK